MGISGIDQLSIDIFYILTDPVIFTKALRRIYLTDIQPSVVGLQSLKEQFLRSTAGCIICDRNVSPAYSFYFGDRLKKNNIAEFIDIITGSEISCSTAGIKCHHRNRCSKYMDKSFHSLYQKFMAIPNPDFAGLKVSSITLPVFLL